MLTNFNICAGGNLEPKSSSRTVAPKFTWNISCMGARRLCRKNSPHRHFNLFRQAGCSDFQGCTFPFLIEHLDSCASVWENMTTWTKRRALVHPKMLQIEESAETRVKKIETFLRTFFPPLPSSFYSSSDIRRQLCEQRIQFEWSQRLDCMISCGSMTNDTIVISDPKEKSLEWWSHTHVHVGLTFSIMLLQFQLQSFYFFRVLDDPSLLPVVVRSKNCGRFDFSH